MLYNINKTNKNRMNCSNNPPYGYDYNGFEEPTSTLVISVQKFQNRKTQIRKNSWTQIENQTYANFLAQNCQIFISQQKRRENKVFRLLSQLIETRTISQVKSHHQKMMIKHQSISAIIGYLLAKKVPSNHKLLAEQRRMNALDNSILNNKEADPFMVNQGQLQKETIFPPFASNSQDLILDAGQFLDL